MGGRGSGRYVHKKTQFHYSKHARDYEDPLYKKWRVDIRKRDHNKCQMPTCGTPKSAIHVHHIKPWALFPALRYEMTNGICLCRICHGNIKGKEQIYEPLLLQISLTNTKKWIK